MHFDNSHIACIPERCHFLQLDVNFINKNAGRANLIPHSQNILIHKSQFTVYALMDCWTKAVS